MTTQNTKFVFVGQATRTGTKIDWPLRIVAKSIRLWLDGVGSAQTIFQALLPELNDIRAENGQEAVDELPKSYTNKNAASLHYNMRQRFLGKLASGDKNVEALAEEFGIRIEQVQ